MAARPFAELSQKSLTKAGAAIAPRVTEYGLSTADVEAIQLQQQNPQSWAFGGGAYWAAPSTTQKLAAGVYRCVVTDRYGPTFFAVANNTDALLELPDADAAFVLDELRKFIRQEPLFRQHGLMYKRGVLLWGPPGSGKTSTLQLAMRTMVAQHDAIAVIVDHPGSATSCVQMLRRLEPTRLVILLMEDLDGLVDKFGESEYLALLDGESQIDRVVTVATTNYPEKLDRRFHNRPGRFDTVRCIGMPTAAARRVYAQSRLPLAPSEKIDELVAVSDGFSVAHLRELIVLTEVFGTPLADAVQKLRGMIEVAPKSSNENGVQKFGFT